MNEKIKINANQNVYKPLNITNTNMNPSDPQGLLDDSKQKAFKQRMSIITIKVPGMALRSNAGLPVISKLYKSINTINISSLRAVSIHPGDLCGRRMIFHPYDVPKGESQWKIH